MLGAQLTLALLLFAGKDPARLLGLERLYFSATSDPGKGAFHPEEVRRLLPGSLPGGTHAAPVTATVDGVTVRDFPLAVGTPTRQVVLRDVHDVSNRIAVQWWCLYDDRHREGCWFFAPAPMRTEGKLVADYRIESVLALAPDRIVLRTAGALIRPQGAFLLQGKDLVLDVTGATLRLDHVVGRYEISRGYAVGSNEGPLFVSTEAEPSPERLVTRTVVGVSPAAVVRCGFRDLDAEGPEIARAALERAALCMTADASAAVSERARSAPSFVEQGGQRPQAAVPTFLDPPGTAPVSCTPPGRPLPSGTAHAGEVMAQSEGGAERRRRPRLAVHGEVMGRIHTVASAPFVDLSETGALLEVSCALKPGAFYALRFGVPEGVELVLKTRVVRSFVQGFQPGPRGESLVMYRTAVEFVEMTVEDRAVLQRHLRSATSPPSPGALDSFDEDFEDGSRS